MNGYLIMAEAQEKLLKEGKCSFEEEKELREKIKIYKFLADLSPTGKYAVFDSSMFNDVFKGYVKMMMDELTESEDKDIQKAAELLAPSINKKAGTILDRVSSKQAEEYYLG